MVLSFIMIFLFLVSRIIVYPGFYHVYGDSPMELQVLKNCYWIEYYVFLPLYK